MNLEKYLQEDEIIDLSNPNIQSLAKELASGYESDEEIAKSCFYYVRDKITHSGDCKAEITTSKASEVLKEKTGWCYAKAHLLAALLRVNNIPTGFCYQRLHCNEYKDGTYCLHGLNAIYLKEYGWYKVDARGNKEGVEATFNPPVEKLAFELEEGEYDIEGIYEKPLDIIIETLAKYNNYDEMIGNFPDTIEKKKEENEKNI